MTTIYNALKNNFTQVSNHALLDIRLSGKAYKLYAYMCYRIGLSDSWNFNKYEILKHFKEGEKAIRGAFDELIKLGFLERKRVRNRKGVFEKTDYIIYAEPINTASDPQAQKRHVDNRHVDNPPVDNASYNNKERINKELNNKDLFSLSEMEDFAREREFKIDVKKFYDWCIDEGELKGSWKNIMKKWANKPENQIKVSPISAAKLPAVESEQDKKRRNELKTSDFAKKIMEKIKNNFEEALYEKWLKDLMFFDYKKDILTLSAPSRFIRDWVIREFGNDLKKIFNLKVSIISTEKDTIHL